MGCKKRIAGVDVNREETERTLDGRRKTEHLRRKVGGGEGTKLEFVFQCVGSPLEKKTRETIAKLHEYGERRGRRRVGKLPAFSQGGGGVETLRRGEENLVSIRHLVRGAGESLVIVSQK